MVLAALVALLLAAPRFGIGIATQAACVRDVRPEKMVSAFVLNVATEALPTWTRHLACSQARRDHYARSRPVET